MKGLPTTYATPDEKASNVEKGSTDVSGKQVSGKDDTSHLAIFTKISTRQILLLIFGALLILVVNFPQPFQNAVNSVLYPSGNINHIKSYEAGLASHGWEFGDDQLVDRRKLDRILLEWARQEEGANENTKHHRCDKHGKGPHTIGPKEAEALFLTVPKNDSLAA